MIRQVSVRVQSRTLDVAQLSALLDEGPTAGTKAGDSVSSRLVDGSRRQVTTWIRSSGLASASSDPLNAAPTFGEHIGSLRQVIDAVSRARVQDPDLQADLVVMMDAAPLGAMVDLEPEHLSILAGAGCGLIVDAYDSDQTSTTGHDLPVQY